jgi:peptidyl-prolyl cis-trans isomerase A (cyclophilin A)
MLRHAACVLLGLVFPLACARAEEPQKAGPSSDTAKPVAVKMVTTMGDIVIELDAAKAPETVKNFLQYVDDKFYDGTIFHRVIHNFMIQGGGFTEDLKQKETRPPIRNEAANGLKNRRGTVAMARTGQPHSATAQFFVNVVDNAFLDYPGRDNWGYCVFGKVLEGMDVVDKIKSTKVKRLDNAFANLPMEPVVIRSVARVAPVSQPAAQTMPAEKK